MIRNLKTWISSRKKLDCNRNDTKPENMAQKLSTYERAISFKKEIPLQKKWHKGPAQNGHSTPQIQLSNKITICTGKGGKLLPWR